MRNLGHDVLTALEDKRANQKIPDEDVLKRATELERAVITINRIDFIKLHKANAEHTGIVVCTFDADFVGQAKRIDEACKEFEEIKGKLIRVYRPSQILK
ncbi:MAG: DUF5615 family PIN-like protein [Aridibacter sp.]